MPEGTRRLDAAKAAYRSIRGVPGRTRGVDIVVVSPGELERGRDDIGTLTRELHRDGRSLYREASLAGG